MFLKRGRRAIALQAAVSLPCSFKTDAQTWIALRIGSE
jgi:plasmid maintenance system antidote protein VapI